MTQQTRTAQHSTARSAAVHRRPHERRWFAALAAVPLLTLAGGVAWLEASGTPLLDAWVCADGEIPVVSPAGGSACIAQDDAPEPGWSADVFGNRPLNCHRRWGWTEVYVLEINRTDPDHVTTDCVRDDAAVPEGWAVVPQGWEPVDGRPINVGAPGT